LTAAALPLVRAALASAGAGPESCAWFVPGRIEVLGKHTDYAGGRSLICAVEQGFVAAAAARDDGVVRIIDVAGREQAELSLRGDSRPLPSTWVRYPATVVRRVARNFPSARGGADIAFLSDLPPASGMSSSSAFMVSVFLALAGVNGLDREEAYRREISSPEDLAGYLATIENGHSFGALTGDGGVGTFGGSEDHTAMLCCRVGRLSQYAFSPVRFEGQMPCPAGRRFVVAVSGVRAEKTGAAKDAYNRVSLAVRAIVDLWRAASGREAISLADAVARAGVAEVRGAIERASVDGFTVSALLDRFDQFVTESTEIIPAAAEALAARDTARFGALVDRSQALAERRLGNQIPETVALARLAREQGAEAASAFGAGFGGSVWALVPDGRIGQFARDWEAAYRRAFPRAEPSFLVTGAGAAASRL
jgi:galactokinase